MKRSSYAGDLHRRWRRSKLKLELARRHTDLSGMRAEIAALLALSSQAGSEASAYRDHLETLDRAAEAALAEVKRKED
jgi:hypothetical protein